MRINELISRDPAAWTTILQQRAETQAVLVTHVSAAALSQSLIRFSLKLAEHSDPITLIGKRTNATEAAFYRDLGPRLGFLTARCWYSYVGEERGWVVIEDIPDNRPPEKWGDRDVERVVGNLAALHIAHWNRPTELQTYSWLPWFLWSTAPHETWTPLAENIRLSRSASNLVSPHAIASAGPLTLEFYRAAVCLATLQKLGGWPGVIEQPFLDAVADLLDDPVPMLYPLRSLPSTLLHGEPAPRHWRLTLFGDCNLLDWQGASIGPSVCDLVSFVENIEQVNTLAVGEQPREVTQIRMETLVDTYLLRMYEALWPLFNPRELRKAMPAAQCLYVMTQWLPVLSHWFDPLVEDGATLAQFGRITDQHLLEAGCIDAVRYRPYLADLLQRFTQAFRTL